ERGTGMTGLVSSRILHGMSRANSEILKHFSTPRRVFVATTSPGHPRPAAGSRRPGPAPRLPKQYPVIHTDTELKTHTETFHREKHNVAASINDGGSLNILRTPRTSHHSTMIDPPTSFQGMQFLREPSDS